MDSCDYETIEAEVVRTLISDIIEAKDEIGGNPGVELFEGDGGVGEIESSLTVKEKSGYRYIALVDGEYVIWGKKPIDVLLQAFNQLQLKEGFRIDGYYLYEGMGGNFQPVAFSEGIEFPDWHDFEHNPVFSPDKIPPSLDIEITPYIIPSGTPESYFQKSLFMREVYSHGAYWHGCGDWSIRGIVTDKKELMKRVVVRKDDSEEGLCKYRFPSISQTDLDSVPEILKPMVLRNISDGTVKVSFYFYTDGLGGTRGLFEVIDKFTTDGSFITERNCIINMGDGPIP